MQGDNIIIVINNNSYTINRTHIKYDRLKEAIKSGKWDTVQQLVEPRQMVLDYGQGKISIKGETIYWQGREMHNALTRRLVKMLEEEFPVEPLVKFMENLMENPSHRAVNELYGFLENNNLPITPDGHFLAYKKVRADYTDCHSGTFDNSVGQIVEMERNAVDDDYNRTCSTGLHFCSQEYLKHFHGDHIMIVKVNPRDVVSVPRDYNNSKCRCCRYEVVGELGVAADQAFTQVVQENSN